MDTIDTSDKPKDFEVKTEDIESGQFFDRLSTLEGNHFFEENIDLDDDDNLIENANPSYVNLKEELFNSLQKEDTEPTDPEYDSKRWSYMKFSQTAEKFDDQSQAYKKPSIFQLSKKNSELDIFITYFSEPLIGMLVESTNNYAANRIAQAKELHKMLPFTAVTRWKETNKQEMIAFISILIAMGVHKLPKLEDYWSDNPLFKTEFAKLMQRDRFLILWSLFHISDTNLENGKIIYSRVSSFVSIIQEMNSRLCKQVERVNINEQEIRHRGRILTKQNEGGKSAQWGLKLYSVVDCDTGYMYDFKFYLSCYLKEYCGSSTLGSTIIKQFAKNLNSGTHIYADEFFTSVPMVEHLTQKNIFYTGTFDKCMKHQPEKSQAINLKILSQENQQMVTFFNKDFYSFLQYWADYKVFRTLSNGYANEVISVQQPNQISKKMIPEAFYYYTKFSQVNKEHENMRHFYRFSNASFYWWKSIFLETLEIVLVNSFIIYKRLHRRNQKYDQLDFRTTLLDQLLGDKLEREPKKPSINVDEQHFPDYYEIDVQENYQRMRIRCAVCGKKTMIVCKKCCIKWEKNIGLCVPLCFKAFHKQN